MAENGGKGANGREHNTDGTIPLKLCLQHCCHSVCSMFLESSVEDCEFEAARNYISIISSMMNLLFVHQTPLPSPSSNPKSRPVTLRKECNYEALGNTDLQLLLVLTTFCVKIWSRDLEVVDDGGQLKSLSDYVEYFFDILSYSDGGISGEESGSEGSRNKRKRYIIRHLNSQRILLKNDGSMNTKEVISLFNELSEKKLVLYPKEVKQAILNPQLEVPNFLHYASFFLAVKQIVIDILEKCGNSFLDRLQNMLAKSNVLKNKSFSGYDCVLLHDVFDGFGDIDDMDIQEGSPERQTKNVASSIQEGLPSQDDHPEIEPMTNEVELPSTDKHPEIEQKVNDAVRIDSTVNKEQKKHSTQKRRVFTKKEETWLRKGVKKYGVGNWKVILKSYPFYNRTSVNLKDKFRNMMKNDQL